MVHRIVATTTAVIHAAFVVFAVLGGFIAWLIPWLFLPHLLAAMWGGRMVFTRAACPLSNLENWGRARAGRPTLSEDGFIVHYFEDRLYPAKWRKRVVLVAAGLVLGSLFGTTLR
jgi:hypothetical protein